MLRGSPKSISRSAVAAGGHQTLERLALQNRLLRSDGGNDDIGGLEGAVPIAPRNDLTAELLREFEGALLRAIHEIEMSDAAVTQLRNDLFADGTGAEHQSRTRAELSENALGQLHAGGSGGHGPSAEFRFRAHALADFERALEEPVQHGAGRAKFMRPAIRFANLAENFRFTKQHGVESRGDAEEMTNRFAVVAVIQGDAQNIRPHGMK